MRLVQLVEDTNENTDQRKVGIIAGTLRLLVHYVSETGNLKPVIGNIGLMFGEDIKKGKVPQEDKLKYLLKVLISITGTNSGKVDITPRNVFDGGTDNIIARLAVCRDYISELL